MPLAKDLALLAAWAAGSAPGKAARMRARVGSRMGAGCPRRACCLGGWGGAGLWPGGACMRNRSIRVLASVHLLVDTFLYQ